MNALRHIQMVDGFHGDGDVGDGIVDLFLRTGQRLVAEHPLSVALVRAEEGVAVMGDEPTEPLAHIEDAKLRPQIHKTVAAWRAGQAHAGRAKFDFIENSSALLQRAAASGQYPLSSCCESL